MSFNVHHVGDKVRLTGTFTVVSGGAAIDPDVVNVRYKDPAGVTTTKTYATHPEVVKDSVGVYHIDISADQAGTYFFRWFSTGDGQAADNQRFKVETDPTA